MTEVILINNIPMARQDKHINVYDRGFMLGYGIFETMRAVHGELVDFQEHWQRLVDGLTKTRIPIPFTMEQCQEQCHRCLQLNQLHTAPLSGLRLTVTYGEAPRGLAPIASPSPTVAIICFNIAQSSRPPLSLLISDYVKNQLSPLHNVKTLNYLENSLAKQQAIDAGADEAILLNTHGRIAECTTSNIFIVKDNVLITPSIAEGALAGITRSTILQQAAKQQIQVIEGSITVADLFASDEVFITNSITPVQLVGKINQQVIPRAPSSIARLLQ